MGTLTGKTRLRAHTPFFGATLLVLQVEVQIGCLDDYQPSHPGKEWHDAKVEDLEIVLKS